MRGQSAGESLARHIPVMKPLLPSQSEVGRYLRAVDESRVYSNYGRLCHRLAERLAHHFGVEPENVLLLANGTLALQGAISTASLRNSEWSIPAWTFVATAQAVVSAGARILLEDVSQADWRLHSSVSRKSEGVIAVAPFGDHPRLENWISESKRHPVVIDAASCFDACGDLSEVNRSNIAVMVSLHATKLVSTGEGGVLIGPRAWISEVRKWSNFGFWGDRIARAVGTNAKLSEFNAAVGMASLDNWSRSRRQLARRVQKLRSGLAQLGVGVQPAIENGFVTSTLVANFESAERKTCVTRVMQESNIESRDWWASGLHKMPAFSDCAERIYGVTDELAAQTVGLPLYVDMSEEDIDRVIDVLGRAPGSASGMPLGSRPLAQDSK